MVIFSVGFLGQILRPEFWPQKPIGLNAEKMAGLEGCVRCQRIGLRLLRRSLTDWPQAKHS